MNNTKTANIPQHRYERIIFFIWQHLLLAVSLFIMTFGVALCVRSNLGCSVISTIPYVMTQAGNDGMVPGLTIGQYTYIMNFVLVLGQILILRRKFEPAQLFQLIIGFVFGYLLDANMYLTSSMDFDNLPTKILTQFVGCTVLGFGIAAEIRCGSVTMPGEGFPVAISRATGMAFAKAKIIVDISLVAIAVVSGYCFFNRWMWNVVGPGTLFAMIYVGYVVKLLAPHMDWVYRLLDVKSGPGRYLFGLARFIYKK